MDHIILLIIAYFALFYIQKKTVNHEAVLNLIKEYRLPEMHKAVKNLYDFSRKKQSLELLQPYDLKIAFKNNIEMYEIQENAINNNRRLVSQYYDYLAIISENWMVPKKFISRLFSIKDLEIIPNIIIPMEWGLREIVEDKIIANINEYINISPTSKLKMEFFNNMKRYMDDKLPFHCVYYCFKLKIYVNKIFNLG